MDLKLANNAAHLKYPGVSNKLILQNFALLKNSGKPFLVRTPLIPGITNTTTNLTALQKNNWHRKVGAAALQHLSRGQVPKPEYTVFANKAAAGVGQQGWLR